MTMPHTEGVVSQCVTHMLLVQTCLFRGSQNAASVQPVRFLVLGILELKHLAQMTLASAQNATGDDRHASAQSL